jgi:hypothetical protein
MAGVLSEVAAPWLCNPVDKTPIWAEVTDANEADQERILACDHAVDAALSCVTKIESMDGTRRHT